MRSQIKLWPSGVFLSLIFTLLISGKAQAQQDLNFAPLEFANKASCALLSQKPARSAFMMVDTFLAGKAGLSLGLRKKMAKIPQADPQKEATRSAKMFRILLTYQTTKILEMILNGQLPLLREKEVGQFYKTNQRCLDANRPYDCPMMNDLLSDIWARAHMKTPRWTELGLDAKDFYLAPARPTLGCHIVKKFSAFHSTLKNPTVDQGVMENIAFASKNPEETLESCFSYSETVDPRYAIVQLDLADMPDEKLWNLVGHDVWYTLKLFLSWSWRHSPELLAEYRTINPEFRSLALEDALMIVPNGCRTIEPPRCEQGGLVVDAMRAAKYMGGAHIAVAEVPMRPIDMLFTSRSVPATGSDHLGLFANETATLWLKDYKEKLSVIRGMMLSKWHTSIENLRLISALQPVDTLMRDLSAQSPTSIDASELFLACQEFNLAHTKLFEDIRNEIEALGETKELDRLMLNGSRDELKRFIEYYTPLQNFMDRYCGQLEARRDPRILNSNVNLKYALNEWAYRILYTLEVDQYNPAYCTLEEHRTNPLSGCPQTATRNAYLSLASEGPASSVQTTVCRTELECARKVLKSLVSIVSIRRYARAFLPLQDIIQTPTLINSMAMPTACKLYDPFLKKKIAWKMFLADLGSSALMGLTCGGLNFQLHRPKMKEVSSFREVHDGHMSSYEPQMRTLPAKWSLGVNFAGLAGVPCSLMYSNMGPADIAASTPTAAPSTRSMEDSSGDGPSGGPNGSGLSGGHGPTVHELYNSYLYVGASFNVCKGKSVINERVANVPIGGGPVMVSDMNSISYRACVSCSLNFVNLPQMIASPGGCLGGIAYGNVAGVAMASASSFGMGLFQGLLRLYSNLKDPINIPKTSTIDIDQIASMATKFQKIPKKCFYRIKKGYECKY